MTDKFFKTGVFTSEQLVERRKLAGKGDIIIALGERLRTARKMAGLSRAAIALQCGTNADQLGRFEHGLGSISYVSLRQLCAALNLSLVDLIIGSAGLSPEATHQTMQMAETWTGKPLMLEDVFLD